MTIAPKTFLLRRLVLGVMALAIVSPVAFVTAHGQVTTSPAIKIKQKTQIDSFRGEVVNWTPVAITVRDPKNSYTMRTFTFTPELTRKVENRHMEKGSKVTVKHRHMSDTAVSLKGKLLKQQ